jgi:hypothetical protein
VAHRSQHVTVKKRVKATCHSAAGAVKASSGLERACREYLSCVGVDDANGNATSKSNAAGNPKAGPAAPNTRRPGRWRGRALVCRIDRVRQHIASLGLASP